MRSSRKKIVLIALGGNALSTPHGDGSIEEQRKAVELSAKEITKIVQRGWSVVLTHGNGPQVGRLLLQQESGKDITPPLPFDVCGAMTQGQIGYLLQQGLREELYTSNDKIPVVTLLTQVVVERDDPAFQNPTKPVGPFYSEREAGELAAAKKFTMKKMGSGARPYRRVVASPRPGKIIEEQSIKELVAAGHVVIACGGGGVPVVNENGRVRGVDAVIDKDRASNVLAGAIGAEVLLILTDVEHVSIHFGRPDQQELSRVTADEIQRYLDAGEFPAGSMGPKIEAALSFLRNGGQRVIITSLEKANAALDGETGTEIIP